jgi:hypothetical protein
MTVASMITISYHAVFREEEGRNLSGLASTIHRDGPFSEETPNLASKHLLPWGTGSMPSPGISILPHIRPMLILGL